VLFRSTGIDNEAPRLIDRDQYFVNGHR